VLAVLGRGVLDAVELAGPDNLAGKLVIDTTTPALPSSRRSTAWAPI
jgi:hypothetical protein